MKGIAFLKRVYAEEADDTCKLLTSSQHLPHLLEDMSIVIFLRHLENLDNSHILTEIKTLFLAVRLCKFAPQKLRGLFPHERLQVQKPISTKMTLDEQLLHIIFNKLVQYLNFLLVGYLDLQGSYQVLKEELELLTANLNNLMRDSMYCKDVTTVRYCEAISWLAEEQLYRLWVGVDRQLCYVNELEAEDFQLFYKQYTLFCTFRRKIPSIRHKQLKAVEITPRANRRVEEKYRELKGDRKGHKFLDIRSNVPQMAVSFAEDIEGDF